MAGKWSTYEIRIAASFRSTNSYRARDINTKLEKAARDVCVSHALLIAPTNYFRRHRRRRRRKGGTVKDGVSTRSEKFKGTIVTLKNRRHKRTLDLLSAKKIPVDTLYTF